MQIGHQNHLNHLNFPTGPQQALLGNAADEGKKAAGSPAGAARPGLGATVRTLTPAQDAPGIILKLQRDNTATPGPGLANGMVYSNGRKSAASDTAEGDTARMAEQHRMAMERSQGSATQLTVDKNGLLVAQAAPVKEAAEPGDFVSFAVHAMRDYADEQERLKASTKQADNASPTSLIARGLGDMQKLAARFKMFA